MVIKCPKCNSDNPSNSKFCKECGTQLRPSEETAVTRATTPQIPYKELTVGSIFAGRYKVIEKLGSGGMGVVYKAQDMKLKRTIALKILPQELTHDLEYKQRFIQEAQAASVLDHQNICTIHEIDETEDGQMFIAMAFYPGSTLKQKIKPDRLQIKDAVDLVIQIAKGLSKAHSQGIVHRDIKPANIMISGDGVVKIVDFGLAKLVGQTEITRTATAMGTIAYMSPEQVCGEALDHRTDLWSLGVVFYESLTGELPFKGENVHSMVYSVTSKSPIPPRELIKDIPEEAEHIILKCLRKEQEDRYQSAIRLLSDLTKLKEALERAESGLVDRKKKPETKKETERRHATVMFVEISGYNEMLESMHEEEVASIMNSCFKMFDSIARKYEGTIDEIMENSMKVLFGVPAAIEEAPKKAINAAIEMRNKLYQYGQEEKIQVPFDIHIGINTGTVIAGAIGPDEIKSYTVMGDTVIFACQLKDLSAKGQICVGPSTYRYTRNDFEYKSFKPISLKGKKEPVSVFELLSVKEKIYRAAIGSDRMVFSDMVGRDNELDKLRLHVLKVINGEGSIVNVIGEAGIGKSRLIAELRRKDEMKKVHLHKGRALAIGKNLSFHPIIDIMKNWAGIKEEDNISESSHKLEKTIRSVYTENSEEIFPFIAILMGMKLTGKHAERIKGIEGEALEKLILKNLREFFEKATKQKPLVIFIEDLHWADLTSIEFLESLYRLAENNRILFINVFRPDYKETSERISKTVKSRYNDFYSEIVLGSLDDKQSEILINNLLKIKGLVPNIRELIIKKTGGNPFFIEEVVRSFIDDGIVNFKNGSFQVTEKIDSVVIPETINEVIMARIDKLDENTKSLLKVASVIGRNFFYKILVDVAKTIEEIDDSLECLKEAQLILEQRRMEELEYLFKHVLVQETTYASILQKKRKELHLRIAKSFESIFSERLHEFFGILALHFSKGEDLDKAEEYLIKAGEEALKSSASSEALHYYREALKIYLIKYGDNADPEKIAMLEKNIALALYNKGQYVESDEYFSRVLTYYGERFPEHSISIILKFFTGFLSFLIGLYFPNLKKRRISTRKDSEVINLFYKKDTALVFLDPKRMFIESFYWLKKLINSDIEKIENGIGILSMSSAAFLNGGISFKLSRKVQEFVKDKVDKNDVKSELYYKVPEILLNTFSGNWGNVVEYDDNLVKHSVRIGELFYASLYILIHGYSKIEKGCFVESQEYAQKLYEIANVYEHNYSWAAYYWYKTQILTKFRKLNEALIMSEDGIDFTNKTGFRPYMFSIYSIKARVQIMKGDIEKAEYSLQYLDKIKHELNLAPYLLCTYYLSKLIFDLHRLEESIKNKNASESAHYRKSALKAAIKAIKNSRKTAADLTESYKLKGVYYWLTGKQKKALTWFEKSIGIGEHLGALPELARTYLEVGKRLLEKKSRFIHLNNIQAAEYLEKARILFQEMDLEWDLEELDKIEVKCNEERFAQS